MVGQVYSVTIAPALSAAEKPFTIARAARLRLIRLAMTSVGNVRTRAECTPLQHFPLVLVVKRSCITSWVPTAATLTAQAVSAKVLAIDVDLAVTSMLVMYATLQRAEHAMLDGGQPLCERGGMHPQVRGAQLRRVRSVRHVCPAGGR